MDSIEEINQKIENHKVYKVWKANEKFFHFLQGIAVIILLIWLITLGVQSHNKQQEISETCGWSGEDYECYCQKDVALGLKNRMNNIDLNLEDLNVSVGM